MIAGAGCNGTGIMILLSGEKGKKIDTDGEVGGEIR